MFVRVGFGCLFRNAFKTASGPSVQSDVLNLQKQTAYYDPECDLPPSDFYTHICNSYITRCCWLSACLKRNFCILISLCLIKRLYFSEKEICSRQIDRESDLKFMEVLTITDAIVAGKRVDHCGVLILMPNIVCVPREDGVFKCEIEDKDQLFYSKKKSCFGIVKYVNGRVCDDGVHDFDEIFKTSIFHIATLDLDTSNKNQIDYLLKFMASHSQPSGIRNFESKTEFEHYMERFENVGDLVEAFWNPRSLSLEKCKTSWKCCESDEKDSMSCFDRTYRHYLRPYASFLKRNPVEKQEGKKILGYTKNVVKFVKSLGWENDTLLLEAVSMFLMRHGCENPHCDSFSYLKCQSCLSAHYCNEDCQETDWNEHRLICGHMKMVRERELKVPEFIHDMLQEHYGHQVMTFQAFFRNLQLKIYEACYNTLKTKEAQNFVQNCLSNSKFSPKSKTKMLQLLKNENSKKLQLRKELMKQISQAYGPFNKIFLILG